MLEEENTEEQKSELAAEETDGFVRARIWKREGPYGIFFKVSLDRLYRKHGEEELQQAWSFGKSDFESITKVLENSRSTIEQLEMELRKAA